MLLLADSLNAAFNVSWIYGVLINQFGAFQSNLWPLVQVRGHSADTHSGNISALESTDWREYHPDNSPDMSYLNGPFDRPPVFSSGEYQLQSVRGPHSRGSHRDGDGGEHGFKA